MIIGIDASRANREHKSGTEWYSFHLIRNLAHLDSKNEYILYTDKPLKKGLADLTNLKTIPNSKEKNTPVFDKKGYQTIKSPHNNFKAKVLNWPFSYFWTLGRLSLEMLFQGKPDVLFVPAHTFPLIHPKKTVNTIHDIAFEKNGWIYRKDKMGAETNWGRKIINFLVKLFTWGKYSANSIDYLRWSTNFALKRATKIITVSDFTKKEIIERYNYDADKIKTIYNGYNTNLYKRIEDKEKITQVLNKYGLERPYILYVGRLEKKKNTPLLVESFAQALYNYDDFNFNLVLIGDAGFGYDEVQYAIEQYDLRSKVCMPGWVEEIDMPYIYSGANSFIFPSKHEGFGIPILQAFACELPVIASYITPLREVGGKAILFFDPNDRDSIAKSIYKINTEEKLRRELIQNGKMRVQNFSWEKCAQETLELLENL